MYQYFLQQQYTLNKNDYHLFNILVCISSTLNNDFLIGTASVTKLFWKLLLVFHWEYG